MKLWQLVVLMAVVTYTPRMLPLVFLKDSHLPPRMKAFLEYIPFAALTALVFPGILNSTGDYRTALAGATAAILLALVNANLIIVVFGSILGVFLWGMI